MEALRTVSFERPSMTERALIALEANGRFGLTVRKLYEKSEIWLFFPDDGPEWTTSVKAVSMLLRRLNHRLAARVGRKPPRNMRAFFCGARREVLSSRTVFWQALSKEVFSVSRCCAIHGQDSGDYKAYRAF